MKDFSKTRMDFGSSTARCDAVPLDFLQNKCDIHGRFGDMVYRRKCNGQPWIYDYVYNQKS